MNIAITSFNSITSEMNQTLMSFLSDRKLQGFRNTKGIKSKVKQLLTYLVEHGLNFQEVTIQKAQDYQAWLLSLKHDNGQKYQAGSITNFLKGAKVFYDYLKKVGLVNSNPFTELRRIQTPKRFTCHIPKEKETLMSFLSDRELQGFRNKKGMKSRVKKLLIYLAEHELDFQEMTMRKAQDYQAWLLSLKHDNGQKYQAGSITNFLKGARAFYDYLKKEGLVYFNPFAELRRIRTPKRIPRNVLKEKEMIQLLTEMRNYKQHKDIRHQKILYKMHVLSELLYSTGLRIGEAANIKQEDIDFNRGIITVIDIKSGNEKIVFLNDYAKQILKIYVDEMKDLVLEKPGRPECIFGVNPGRLIVLLNRTLRDISQRFGMPITTSHSFRHALGYHFLRAGCDIRYIQEILCHKNISSTEIYTKVDKKDLGKVLDKYHPRSWKKNHEKIEL